jgi:hypothetical protein
MNGINHFHSAYQNKIPSIADKYHAYTINRNIQNIVYSELNIYNYKADKKDYSQNLSTLISKLNLMDTGCFEGIFMPDEIFSEMDVLIQILFLEIKDLAIQVSDPHSVVDDHYINSHSSLKKKIATICEINKRTQSTNYYKNHSSVKKTVDHQLNNISKCVKVFHLFIATILLKQNDIKHLDSFFNSPKLNSRIGKLDYQIYSCLLQGKAQLALTSLDSLIDSSENDPQLAEVYLKRAWLKRNFFKDESGAQIDESCAQAETIASIFQN